MKQKPTVTIRPVHRSKIDAPASATHVIYINRVPRLFVTHMDGRYCTKSVDASPSAYYHASQFKSLKALVEDIRMEEQ